VAIVSAIECFARLMTGAGISSKRSREANSASATVSPLMCLLRARSIANVLQEPLGRNRAAEPLRLGELIDTPGERPELVTLQVAPLRVGDLRVGRAASTVRRDDVGKRDRAVRRKQRAMATATLGLALEAGLDVGPTRVGEILVVHTCARAPR